MNINVNFNTSEGNDVGNNDSDDESSSSDEEIVSAGIKSRPVSASARSVRSARQIPLRYDFWDRHFSDMDEVTWINFRKSFENDYKQKITENLNASQVQFLVNLIYKDIFNLKKSIKRQLYDQFCEGNPDADPHRFFNRLQQYAVGYYAMREVFNMNSSLRMTTIQNLGRYVFKLSKVHAQVRNCTCRLTGIVLLKYVLFKKLVGLFIIFENTFTSFTYSLL